MKKVIFALFIGISTTAAFAQVKDAKSEKKEEKTEEKMEKQVTIPDVVKKAFAKDYPGIKAKWDAEDGGFEAGFKQNGVESSASYNAAGHKESSEVEIKTTLLPASVLAYVKKNYPDYKLVEASKVTDDKKVVTYEAEIKDEAKKMDLIFDSKGTFMKTEEGD